MLTKTYISFSETLHGKEKYSLKKMLAFSVADMSTFQYPSFCMLKKKSLFESEKTRIFKGTFLVGVHYSCNFL